MKALFIIVIVLGAIAVFEGSIYHATSSPMGFHPSRGTAIILVGVVLVIGGIAGLVIRSRKSRV